MPEFLARKLYTKLWEIKRTLRIKSFIQQLQPSDVLIIANASLLLTLAPYLRKIKHPERIVGHFHSSFTGIDGIEKDALENWKQLSDICSDYVALSPADAQEFSSFLGKEVWPIANPTPLTPLPEPELPQEPPHVFVYAGRLAQGKQVKEIIRAFDQAQQELPNDWELRIHGSGVEEKSLSDFASRLSSASQIKFAGPYSNPKEAFSNAGVGVLYSLFEGFPMVFMEAGNQGVPYLTAPSSAACIEVAEECGWLVGEKGNFPDLVQAFKYLMSNPEQINQRGKRAWETSKKYQPENIFTLWEPLLGPSQISK